ncbi:MAG: NAD-glutamate dehydrogenase [Burkholderiales bacterium]|nr:NAD-glutamate dehydrogenase [Burkholderiales bacterium]
MDASTDATRRERIDALAALAGRSVDAAARPQVEAFARSWAAHLDADDLAARSTEDLLGAVLSCWQFGAERQPGTVRLRVLSPTLADSGWSTRHTVLQVINDDMPFLVDTTTMEVHRQGLTLHLIVHPVLVAQRDAQGRLLGLRALQPGESAPDGLRESWMHVEVDRLVDAQARAELAAGVERVLADVRAAVQDWRPMLQRLRAAADDLQQPPPSVPAALVAESRAFLQWLADDHFTLLGYRCHDLVAEGGEDGLRLVPDSALGILRAGAQQMSASFAAVPPQARAMARAPAPMVLVTRSNTRSTVHRPGYSDYVGVKRYDADGRVIGEHRFVGLFTSTAYSARVGEIPLLREKVARVTARAALPDGGHLAKALEHILATYPRDDLFQIGEDELYDTALGILAATERQRLRLFVWRDPYERFVSCLVYVPRDAYSTEMRRRFQAILLKAFAGTRADSEVQLGDTILARAHFTIRTQPGQVPPVDTREIEAALAAAARRWDDQLRDALVDEVGEARGLELFKRWGSAFPQVYREIHGARAAVPDVLKLDGLSAASPLALALYRPLGVSANQLGFKVYRRGATVVLSDSLPMLEHMGVRVLGEDNFRLKLDADGHDFVSLHDFKLEAEVGDDVDPQRLARLFEDCFAQVFRGEVENDDFNRLVLRAGLAARDVVVLRAYAKYCKQIGFALSQATIEATLAAHPRIAHMLVNLFQRRFDPGAHDDTTAASQVNAIEQALDRVANLNEDRVLRQLLGLVQATLRTNHWRTGVGHGGADGPARPFLSLKFDSAKVPGLPAPRPMFEIFVYSPRFEGIHLRGGKVARGGLRWSDRPEDFRTEILGLVKAQMVKNTVIVPVGSKGGFVLKKAPPAADREAYLKEGVACYQDYLRGLLDLTDNLVAGQAVPPPRVRRLDGDDPYLVVAADKGTATFSDYANAVSAEYGHWLGDAFASGGSVGYDHKAMGITARGAWESVKRHFRELGHDTQNQDFTVVGVGDMSGDVFGNGMLLSRHIRLVAAFDHRHVFIDPAPDAAATFAERQRLFALPRSSWADYDPSLISAGGGVWSRAEKSIPVSPQARAALGIAAPDGDLRLPPNELLSAILKAPVDLLYNGGIGTYVKASDESHAEVGDRANDAIRIDGARLRCRVVGEGGNLGFTQRGRIEAARAGVRLYTDAIDNSAGVDTSDHEVNIKILLGLAVADGEMTEKQRNALLPKMTDDVAALVLADNYYQTQALSIARREGAALLDEQLRFIRHLERAGRLDRAVEFLPGDEAIEQRRAQGEGLTTPELAVLLAYGKMWLSDELVASDLPEDPWVGQTLQRYFPPLLRAQFEAYIPRHPLRREIIATHVLNRMVNRVGPTFVHRLTETTGAAPPQIVRAYLAARDVFCFGPLWKRIEALDAKVDDALQAAMTQRLKDTLPRAVTWFLHPRRLAEPMQGLIDRLTPAVATLRRRLEAAAAAYDVVAAWTAGGVPADLACAVAATEGLYDALDIAEIAEGTEQPLDDVTDLHRDIGTRLGLRQLRRRIDALPDDSHWDHLARIALGDDLAALQRAITLEVLAVGRGSVAEQLQAWEAENRGELDSVQRSLAELGEAKTVDLAMLSVAMRKLRNLA